MLRGKTTKPANDSRYATERRHCNFVVGTISLSHIDELLRKDIIKCENLVDVARDKESNWTNSLAIIIYTSIFYVIIMLNLYFKNY